MQDGAQNSYHVTLIKIKGFVHFYCIIPLESSSQGDGSLHVGGGWGR